MTYSEKIKQSKNVLAAIKALGHSEVLQFTFGTEYCYKQKREINRVFEIKAYTYQSTGDTDYSVYEAKTFGRSMNVDKITSTALKLYSYDMMGTRTTYTMPLYAMRMGLITINADTPITEEVEA